MPIHNSKCTILLVHSFLSATASVFHFLREAGFHILQTTNQQEAIRMAAYDVPDLIIIDINTSIPKLRQFIQELKTNRTTFQIPLLIVISFSHDLYFPHCLRQDQVDFIIKPYHPQELFLRIQRQFLPARSTRSLQKENNRLKQALESRDKLYSIIAHDLRAPIGTIKMLNTTIAQQSHKIKDNPILTLLKMLQATTEEAFNLLENLLSWTRTQNGKTKIHATVFNINYTIRQVVSLFSPLASNKNITIHNHATEDTAVYADEDMIKTVLRNLISNAIKFTYAEGEIDITVSKLPECRLISVKDNGKGISTIDQKKILKPNEHFTTYGTRNEKGSGLGLALSQDFIKRNKGKLWFSSQEGIGTTFFFTLPNP